MVFMLSLRPLTGLPAQGKLTHKLEGDGLAEDVLSRTLQSNRLFLHCECCDINYYSVTRIVICFDTLYSFPKQFVANNTPQILTCGR